MSASQICTSQFIVTRSCLQEFVFDDYQYNNQIQFYNQFYKMALSMGLLAMNSFIGLAGVGLGTAGIILESELKQVQKEIDDLLAKNQALINASNQFQQTVEIMVSPVLQTQLTKVQIGLQSNIDQIQQYYKHLGKLMQGNDPDNFNSIMVNLPGAQMSSQSVKVKDIFSLSLSIMYTLYSSKRTYSQYKKWKNSGKVKITKDYPLDNILQNPNSATSKGIKKSKDAAQVTKGSKHKVAIQSSLKPIKPNSAKNKPFVSKISSTLRGFSKKTTANIGNIAASVAMIGGIVSILSQISNIIKLNQSIADAQNKLNELQAQLDAFFEACLGVLKDMQQFLAAFESVLFIYVTFLLEIQFISSHNVIAQKQGYQKYSQNIASLDISQFINSTTFDLITQARVDLAKVLDGLVIQQKVVIVNGKQTVKYSTKESHEKITKRFQDATNVFAKLDNQIDFVLIYNQFYKRLLKSQIIIKEVRFQDLKYFAKFANQVKKAVIKQEPLQQIEEMYYYEYDVEVDDFTEQDRYNIAQLISFFADTYPGNQPYVYTYKLVDFQMEYDAQFKIDSTKQMHDVDMSNILGTWPQDQMAYSIGHITLHHNVNKDELKYLLSSIYLQNKGTLDVPEYEYYRLQLFQKGKKETYAKYYVLYHGVTNNFQHIRLNALKSL